MSQHGHIMADSTDNTTPFPDRFIDFLTWAYMKSEAAKKRSMTSTTV